MWSYTSTRLVCVHGMGREKITSFYFLKDGRTVLRKRRKVRLHFLSFFFLLPFVLFFWFQKVKGLESDWELSSQLRALRMSCTIKDH